LAKKSPCGVQGEPVIETSDGLKPGEEPKKKEDHVDEKTISSGPLTLSFFLERRGDLEPNIEEWQVLCCCR
jgi:hypothetical protein